MAGIEFHQISETGKAQVHRLELRLKKLIDEEGNDHAIQVNPLFPAMATIAVRDIAEKHDAWRLLDHIATAQMEEKVAALGFQFWNLAVTGRRAELICTDGNGYGAYRADIYITNYPEPGIRLWFSDNVIFLPEEY
jgi:hypothetical protein